MTSSKLALLIRHWVRTNYEFDIDDSVFNLGFIRLVNINIDIVHNHRSMVVYASPPRVSATYTDKIARPMSETRRLFYASDPEFFSKIAKHLRLYGN